MKLIKLKKINDSTFEITYVSGWLFKKEKTAKVYPWFCDWYFTETGMKIPYPFCTSLTNIAQTLKDSETFYSDPKNDRIKTEK